MLPLFQRMVLSLLQQLLIGETGSQHFIITGPIEKVKETNHIARKGSHQVIV
jgi:hypothetical protein